ncbi:haloacid dehalogenase type II [Alphaproteobacteria bacterium]|nr:haloacid dehalogenase type II [Alphaproteobacteria bacterium]
MSAVRALFFDVFGTVVDWRSSISEFGAAMATAENWKLQIDWTEFAEAWRAEYAPSMVEVKSGRRPYARLDILHRENLDRIIPRFGLDGLDESQRQALNLAWHKLHPWADSVPGLTRLKRQFILATMSNGNTALMVNMAKHAGLPWDCILGAEPAQHYKPDPETYLTGADWLNLPPSECMMVAAHNSDLAAARALGFKTAFIARPTEYGPAQAADLAAAEAWDFIAGSMTELADQLHCA